MIRLTRSQVQPIGLDIGFDSVKMLQLEALAPAVAVGAPALPAGPQGLAVVASAREPYPEDVRAQPHLRLPLAMDLVRRMFREHGFQGRRVVTALPREIVHVKNLRLPMIPAHELDAAVQYEAKNIFPFDTDAARVRHLVAGEVRQGAEVRQEVIVVAARNDDVDAFLEQLHRSGAVVEGLDVEPCALYRSVERFIRRREDEQEVNVIVDVGARRSQVVIGRGRDISFLKGIDVGSTQMVDAISQKLGVTPDEARAVRRRLADAPEPADPAAAKRDSVRQAVFDATRGMMEDLGREIALCLRYYSVTFRGQRPTRVKLAGGEARNPQLQAVLNTALTIPVEPARPLYSVDASRMKAADRRGSMSEWTLALGLGLRHATGTFAPRDGRPRDEAGPRCTTGVEVVDINEALQSGAAAGPAVAAPAREVARA